MLEEPDPDQAAILAAIGWLQNTKWGLTKNQTVIC
jgi:hypothetical protein